MGLRMGKVRFFGGSSDRNVLTDRRSLSMYMGLLARFDEAIKLCTMVKCHSWDCIGEKSARYLVEGVL